VRILPLTLVAVVVLGTLTGCGPGPKAQAGQQRADAAVAAAGMQDQLTARYSCTGPLPGSEENCGLKVTIETDDFAVLEQAAAIDFGEEYGSVVRYQGITYSNGLDELDQLRAFEPFVTDEMRGAQVSLSAEYGVRLTLDGMASFAHLCDLAVDLTAGWPFASVSTGRDPDTSAYWELEQLTPEKPELFDETCAQMDGFIESIDDLRGFGYLLYQVDRDRVLVSPDTRFDKPAEKQTEYAEEWFDEHPAPAGLQLDLY